MKKTNAPQAPATPFATPTGNVPGSLNYSGARPTDFTQKTGSDAQRAARGPGRDPAQSRAQTAAEAPEPAAPEPAGNYGQHRDGIDASSIAAGGIVPRAVPTSSRGNSADGGPAPSRPPFKGMR